MNSPAHTTVDLSMFGSKYVPLPTASGHSFANLRRVPLFDRVRDEFVVRFLRDYRFERMNDPAWVDLARSASTNDEAKRALCARIEQQQWAGELRFIVSFVSDDSGGLTRIDYVQDNREFALALAERLITETGT